MSKIIASAAIRGAYSIIDKAEKKLEEAIGQKGEDHKVEFPNTGYYYPVIYSMTGEKVTTLGEFKPIIERCNALLPPKVDEGPVHLPYLGHVLDAGMAALFGEEIIEAMNYTIGPDPINGIWLGAADDIIMRERGIQFVDGTAPGFAAIVGAAPTVEDAVKLARACQEKSLYVFMAGEDKSRGISFAEQLAEAGVEMGWDTRLIPFGKEIYSHIFSAGFANRAAMSFGGVKPGDYAHNLRYQKNRIFAFVLALGEVTDEWYATAAGVINYGFPTIADSDIPQILPTGVCTYEHVVSNVPVGEMLEKAIEVRGLKIVVSKIDVPVSVSPAFEGERIRRDDMQLELRGLVKGDINTKGFELVNMVDLDAVEDGHVEVIGPDIDEMVEGSTNSIGIVVEVAGREMQSDFEPVLERQIHSFINSAQGVFHMGQRNINWIRIHKDAFKAGWRMKHFGVLLHAKFKNEYGAVVDKVQVKVYTDPEKVAELMPGALEAYKARDERIAGLTDDAVNEFYSCTLCQSFAPTHVCVITPEHPGLCGAYSWLDGKACFKILPTGPNQPLEKGKCLDESIGQWDKINDYISTASQKAIERMSAYSMIIDPMTSCGCFEAISALLPMCNGIMIVDRDYSGETPAGMKFTTMANTVGGGNQTPGFVGHSRIYILSKKFISHDGGQRRIMWMNKSLKETVAEKLNALTKELYGIDNITDYIADEDVGTEEEVILNFLTEKNHPALAMDPMF
ncbi:MAG: CO dehydrogenase/CO-methylating acetyl-CoA synthase complex subunit beta [Planctomycetota bacterium]|nr:MAG: CO dehydrogenase/CO-methylating acetyl-CoA synthase complex subunit beta [Planctomycetota bacterium]